MRHAVIMAGGSGTRLWPLSRRARPKQLLRLFDGRSLLWLTRQRLANLFPPENIWVITSALYLDQVAAELPDVPRANLIGEPVGRDTANAIGLAANRLALRDPLATMAVFTADHLISPQDAFDAAIATGLDAAEHHAGALIAFGIIPDRPHTGYGYVRRGAQLSPGVFRAVEFNEKPDAKAAAVYVRSGEYLWNSGMFVWRLASILAELERQLPDNARVLTELARAWAEPGRTDDRNARFATLKRVSVDYGIMEQAQDVALVEMNCRWADVGSWTAIAETARQDKSDNVSIAANSLVVDGSSNTLVSQDDHLIVALGVSDLVIVHSPDATLVCHRDHAEAIKALAEARSKRFGDQYE